VADANKDPDPGECYALEGQTKKRADLASSIKVKCDNKTEKKELRKKKKRTTERRTQSQGKKEVVRCVSPVCVVQEI